MAVNSLDNNRPARRSQFEILTGQGERMRPNPNAKILSVALIDEAAHNARQEFSAESLRELAESIREDGLIHPPTVRPVGERYVLVCGHRRFRAAQLAGMTEVPVIVNDRLSDAQADLLGLIENVQREDLTPGSLHNALKRLVLQYTENGLGGRRAIARALGRDESWVTTNLRSLEDEVAGELLLAGKISTKQALEISRVSVRRGDDVDDAATYEGKEQLAALATGEADAAAGEPVGGTLLRAARKRIEGDSSEDMVLLAVSQTSRGKDILGSLRPAFAPRTPAGPANRQAALVQEDAALVRWESELDTLAGELIEMIGSLRPLVGSASPELRSRLAASARELLELASA